MQDFRSTNTGYLATRRQFAHRGSVESGIGWGAAWIVRGLALMVLLRVWMAEEADLC